MSKDPYVKNINHFFDEKQPEFVEKKEFEKKAMAQKGLMIDVPFSEKDEAKALGARWNPEAKKWFVPDGVAQDKFTKWIKK
jgi:hypothetical protein